MTKLTVDQMKAALGKFLEPSKVKQRLYHGTTADIKSFDPSKHGKHDWGWYGKGHYLTADPETASAYASYDEMKDGEPVTGQNVLPVHVQLKNPYYWPEDRDVAKNPDHAEAITKELIEKGHDGVVVSNKYQHPDYIKHHEVVVFDPRKIKSAIGNRGTYDISKHELTKAKGGSVQPSLDKMKYDMMSHLKKAEGGLVPSVEPAVHAMKRGKGTGAEFMRDLAATPGVKANELLARNLSSLNSLPKMTREEFAGHVAKNPMPKLEEKYSSENKYKQYSMPGGDNYREMLLTMPAKSTPMSYEDWVNNGRIGSFDFNEDKQYDPEYQSPHFSHPNIIAHARLKDRNINGKKVLHAEEIQSDWHQEGRRFGYIDKDIEQKQKEAQLKTKKSKLMAEKIRALSDENKDNTELLQAYMKHHGEYLKAREEEDALRNLQINGVPDAPFKKDWHELALKHLINHAVENGYDTLAVTPGDVHAKRFDLSEHIDRIEYDPIKKHLVGFKDDDPVYEGTVEPQDLGKEIGVDAAHKILKEPSHTLGSYKVLEGKDLSIGGVGMKKFYDKIIPEAMNKLGKPHGAKVYQLPEGGVNLHAMDITPQMREHVKKHGLPMFHSGGQI